MSPAGGSVVRRDLRSLFTTQLLREACARISAGQPLVVTRAFEYEPEALGARVGPLALNERRFDAAEARVAQAVALVGDDLEARQRVLPADGIAAALTDLAREEDACALVLGRDLRVLDAVLGSTSAQLVREAHCPVLVVGPRIRLRAAAPLGLTTAAG